MNKPKHFKPERDELLQCLQSLAPHFKLPGKMVSDDFPDLGVQNGKIIGMKIYDLVLLANEKPPKLFHPEYQELTIDGNRLLFNAFVNHIPSTDRDGNCITIWDGTREKPVGFEHLIRLDECDITL